MAQSRHTTTSTLKSSDFRGKKSGKNSKKPGFDGIIVVTSLPEKKPGTPSAQKSDTLLPRLMSKVPKDLVNLALQLMKKSEFRPEATTYFSFCPTAHQKVVFVFVAPTTTVFETLTLARKVWAEMCNAHATSILVDLRACADEMVSTAADAFSAAQHLLDGEKTSYKSKKDKAVTRHVTFACGASVVAAVKDQLSLTHHTSAGTNLVRRLADMAGNDLTPSAYVKLATTLAKENGIATELLTTAKLKTMGAGGFVAVAQGSRNNGGGILKLTYKPKGAKSAKPIVFVGKGITFDTGGLNIKTTHMYTMHGDMAGSAVALALILQAAQEAWPYPVTSFLAITDNSVSLEAFRPNDIVTALNGTTIEVVDTDAEGRMVLSDALVLACREKPEIIMDFATLTGACIRAISTRYSGVFTNQDVWRERLVEAGRRSGERVWPFPLDDDFGDVIKSETADTKQCRVSGGGVDHIEAAIFLKKFVEKDTPWVHFDMSSIQHPGGLGHVPTETNGGGVRFAREFLSQLLSF